MSDTALSDFAGDDTGLALVFRCTQATFPCQEALPPEGAVAITMPREVAGRQPDLA